MNRVVVILLLVGLPILSYAEIGRFIVHFTDKQGSSFSTSEPEEFLSQRSIDRKLEYSIPITIQDLPVNKTYLEGVEASGANVIHTSRWFNAALVVADDGIIDDLDKLNFVDLVEYVGPKRNGIELNPVPFDISLTPSEPSTIKASSVLQLGQLGADVMHEDGFTGENVLVAVFDSGFKSLNESSLFTHVFENNRLLDSKDFVLNTNNVFQYDDHGTNAFSCIAAKSEPLTGTGYNASFALYLTEDINSEYRIEEYNWLFAAERADSLGVDIISSSLGYNDFNDDSMDYQFVDLDGQTSVVSQAAQIASDKGILVVSSAGNEGRDVSGWPYIIMPADVPDVIAVAAVNNKNNRLSFSSVGPNANGVVKPDVAALGSGVAVLNDKNEIVALSGTSFSAPLISGLAAGLWSKFPGLTNKELKGLILTSTPNLSKPDSLIGHGVPDYRLAFAENILSVQGVMENIVSVFPNPFSSDHISIMIESEYARQTIKFKLYAPSGRMVNSTQIKKYRKGDVLKLEINDVSKGIYILNIYSEGISKNVKLLRY